MAKFEDFKITLADYNEDLIAVWKASTHYDFYLGDIFDLSGDAIVSPANSFGFMDGGIDAVYVHKFGKKVEKRLQEQIKTRTFGELLVGEALLIPTDDEKFPIMISTPTMRVPMTIPDPISVRLAMRAAVYHALAFGLMDVVTPGLGTLTGQMRPEWAVSMMLAGINDVLNALPFPKNMAEASERHYAYHLQQR
jgi:O-acetyl-ADP-ribose deacetylase (regulator of RNase III)